MVKLTEEEIVFLKENFNNHEELINSEHVDDILDPLDDLITYKGFKQNYDGLNEFGIKAQKIYDDIYYNNLDEE